jgi:ubiquinone/menaquinone biosynthesis C-methylase UbiE
MRFPAEVFMPSNSAIPTLKDMERNHWQTHAPAYDDLAGPMTRAAAASLLDAVGARPGMRLLDVCCGPGYGAGQAAARGANASGIDLSPTMIFEAQRLYPAAEFAVGDAELLDFAECTFDAVICAFGLLHLPAPDRAISEAFRVLKSGGRYAWTVWCSPDKAEFLGIAVKATAAHADMNVALPPAPPLFQFADTVIATAALQRAGFTDVASRELPVSFVGDHPEDAWRWFANITVRAMAVFRLQTPEIQRRITASVIEAASAYAVAGKISIPCTAVMYSATKP